MGNQSHSGWIVKVASLVLATFTAFVRAEPAIRWAVDPADPRAVRVEVTGLNEASLNELAGFKSPADWQRVFVVHAGSEPGVLNAPPMAGTYRIDSGIVSFIPMFPLQRSLPYRASFIPKQGAAITSAFTLPAPPPSPPTTVRMIYPSASVVPENLLKFYVQFSAPMSGGNVYDHIRLIDAAGNSIELPFLEIGEELWDPAMTRLTLIIDPGRIKRGVKPLEDIGPALVSGKRFTLVIARAWKDSAGNELKDGFEKRFEVGPADRTPPDQQKWKLQPPGTGTRDAMVIDFGEAMDYALATRMINIIDENGKSAEGDVALSDNERRWSFIPASAWHRGNYKITIPTTIEDLAGNNIGKPFDVDVFQSVQRNLATSNVTLSFKVD